MRHGQALAEYIILVVLVAAAFIAMVIYIGRGQHGNIRSQAEQLEARQYEPKDTTMSNSEGKSTNIDQKTSSSTTIAYGNLQEPDEEGQGMMDEINAGVAKAYTEQRVLDENFVQWALEEAAEVVASDDVTKWDPSEGKILTQEEVINDIYALISDQFKAFSEHQKEREESRTPNETQSSGTANTIDTDSTTSRSINEKLGPLVK